MVKFFEARRRAAAGLIAVVGLFAAVTLEPAEARPRYYGYAAQSFQQFQERRYQEYYGNYRNYGYRYALEVDAHYYGHLYQRRIGRTAAPRRDQARIERKFSRADRPAVRPQVRSVSRRYVAGQPVRESRDTLMPQDGVSIQQPSPSPLRMSPGRTSIIVAEARRYIGGNPTGRRALWCARFMNMVLARTGHRTTGSDMASSFARYGRRVSGPQVGAIAVMSRGRRGGHVGVVSGIDAKGNPIVVSGNHGRRVAEATYSRSRVYAYVMPN